MNLSVELEGSPILKNLSFAVDEGSIIAVIGPNGAGKSTLFRTIFGEVKPVQGSIKINNRNITGMTPHKIVRKGLSRSFQINSVFENLTVIDNVRCALLWGMGFRYSFWNNIEKQDSLNIRAKNILRECQLIEHAYLPVAILSYGELRSLEIAMALIQSSTIVFLDEPTSGLNPTELENMTSLIRRKTTNKTVMIIEHDMQIVENLADKVLVLDNGKIIAFGTYKEVRSQQTVKEAYLGKELSHAV